MVLKPVSFPVKTLLFPSGLHILVQISLPTEMFEPILLPCAFWSSLLGLLPGLVWLSQLVGTQSQTDCGFPREWAVGGPSAVREAPKYMSRGWYFIHLGPPRSCQA